VLTASIVAIALAPVVLGTAGRASTESRSCARGDVAAMVDGVARCLRDGQRCDHFFDRTYHRYGFHCHGLRLETDWRPLLRRPLHLPTVEPGSPCPKTIGRLRNEPPPYGSRVLLGAGPAYPHPVSMRPYDRADPDGVLYLPYGRPEGIEGNWYRAKVLWLVSPSYHGALVIRGRQLDGAGALRFWQERPNDATRFFAAFDLRLPAHPGWLRNGWRDRASTELFANPGCYGFQVDGRTFSRTIVLQIAAN
jgi:hypothetical protein